MDNESPDYRATIRGGAISLVEWTPWLATGGPLYVLLEARGRAGVAIADLTVIRDDDGTAVEVIVHFCCGASSDHRGALADWAARVGYRRIWFDEQVVELEPEPGGVAQTRCPTCRSRLVDADASFWQFVRSSGAFPWACVLCGSDLPQWTRAGQTRRPRRDPLRTDLPRREPDAGERTR